MITSFFKDCVGVFICFDITDSESFEALENWIKILKENCNHEVDMLIIGTKSDLKNERTVPMEKAKEFSKLKNLYYVETSAKETSGGKIEDAFEILIMEAWRRMKGGGNHGSKYEDMSINMKLKDKDKAKDSKRYSDSVSYISGQPEEKGCCT